MWLKRKHVLRLIQPKERSRRVLLYFFAPIAGLLARKFAVAEIFGFSFFGFLVSFLLFLPLAIV